MTFKEFKEKNGIVEPEFYTIRFGSHDIKHQFITTRVYAAEENKTYLWMYDSGYFAISEPKDNTDGEVLEFTGDLSFNEIYDKICNDTEEYEYVEVFVKMHLNKECEIKARAEEKRLARV